MGAKYIDYQSFKVLVSSVSENETPPIVGGSCLFGNIRKTNTLKIRSI